MKFGRTYNLTIQFSEVVQNMELLNGQLVPVSTDSSPTTFTAASPYVVVSYPLTLVFDIRKNVLASANNGHFLIYNLNAADRNKIFHDQYDTLNRRSIVLKAGYSGSPQLPTIFQGNIMWAYSYRQGPDWITEIEAYDGGFGIINSQISTSVPKESNNLQNVIKILLQSMLAGGVGTGAVGNFSSDNAARGMTMVGNSWDSIQGFNPNGNNFIDNENAYILNKDECVRFPGEIQTISSDTGLLETPRRYDARMDIRTLFEPKVHVGQQVNVKSLNTIYNGAYIVVGVEHKGTISAAVDAGVETTINVQKGTQIVEVQSNVPQPLALAG